MPLVTSYEKLLDESATLLFVAKTKASPLVFCKHNLKILPDGMLLMVTERLPLLEAVILKQSISEEDPILPVILSPIFIELAVVRVLFGSDSVREARGEMSEITWF